MLSPGIHASYKRGVAALSGHAGGAAPSRAGCVGEGANQGVGALFETDAASFLADPALGHEVFGSSSLVVRCRDLAELPRVIVALEGQLTATLHLDRGRRATPRRAGAAARAQGGPGARQRLADRRRSQPGDGPRRAVPGDQRQPHDLGRHAGDERFLRPVCFQDLPAALLPPALADGNAWGVARRIDGKREASPA